MAIATFVKNSRVPAFQQIRENLLDEIKSNALRPGDKIDSERILSRQYGVSRMTVRESLRSLIHDNIIQSVPGKGNFVNAIPQSFHMEHIDSFHSQMKRRGIEGTITLVSKSVIDADETVARNLALKAGEAVIHIVRIKSIAGAPSYLEKRFVPYKLCPLLMEGNYAEQSLGNIIKKIGLRVARREVAILPIRINAKTSKFLKVSKGTLGLSVTELLVLDDGIPLKWEERIHRTGVRFTTSSIIND